TASKEYVRPVAALAPTTTLPNAQYRRYAGARRRGRGADLPGWRRVLDRIHRQSERAAVSFRGTAPARRLWIDRWVQDRDGGQPRHDASAVRQNGARHLAGRQQAEEIPAAAHQAFQ